MESWKATNESKRLVGGLFDQGRGREPPTSRDDSLVVVESEVEGGGSSKATNEYRRLIGGCLGGQREVNGVRFSQSRGWRKVGSHQRVTMTRWWSLRARLREGDGWG